MGKTAGRQSRRESVCRTGCYTLHGVPTQGGKADVAFVTAALARYTASIPSSVPRGSDIVTPSTWARLGADVART